MLADRLDCSMSSLPETHRPSCFDDVIGQPETVASLKHVLKDKRARQFIFCGPSGVGKTTLARIIANLYADGKATAHNIIDVSAAENTGVEDVRRLLRGLQYRAMGASPIKSVILDEAHRLSGNAWDALLKPIEEPLSHIVWFICTTLPDKIPKTIRTRCLRYDLNAVSEEGVLELLIKVSDKEQLEVADAVLEAIAESSEGSPRLALNYLEACKFAESATDARRLMRNAGQIKEAVDLARILLSRGTRPTWASLMRLVKDIKTDAESIRIIITNYFGGALLKAKGEREVKHLLRLLECFSKAYNPSDKMAPLFLSIGMALGLDQ